MKLPLRGGCQCGAVRFEISENPMALYCCHCKSKKQGHFCGECGTRIANDTVGKPALSLKAGTLDDRAQLKPVGHIWVKSAQDWMIFESDALIYEGPPDDGYFALMQRYADQEYAS